MSLDRPKPSSVLAPADPWAELRALTPARLALGRSGGSLPTRELLAFGIDHALARDAVHAALDVAALGTELAALSSQPVITIDSAAPNRAAYLARPDWGRRLSTAAAARLADTAAVGDASAPDIAIVVADGLSAVAAQRHAVPLLRALLPRLSAAARQVAPLVIATQARVALADAVAAALGARLVVCLIGERPGLSAPDSLGAYVTVAPRPGRTTDAERDCLSNIRPQGLPPDRAAEALAALIGRTLQAGRSGVARAAGAAAIGDREPAAIRTPRS